jgi:hypothetical protein
MNVIMYQADCLHDMWTSLHASQVASQGETYKQQLDETKETLATTEAELASSK